MKKLMLLCVFFVCLGAAWAEDNTVMTVEITALENSSALHKKIGEENLNQVEELTIKGTMNGYDMLVLRNKMPNLRVINMRDVRIVANPVIYYTGQSTKDDEFPAYAFYNSSVATKLTSAVLPTTVTSVGTYAFYGCSLLKNVVVNDQLTEVGDYALSTTGVTSITFKKPVKKIGRSAFQSCRSLTSVVFEKDVELIDANAFYGCTKLDTLQFKARLKEIGAGAFQSCTSLVEFTFGQGLRKIGNNAFQSCAKLKEVTIPSSVQSLGNNAFYACTALQKVYTMTIEPMTITQTTFSGVTFGNALLYVPKTSYYNYYWNTQWSQFAHLTEYDAVYDYFYVNNDYVIDDETGVVTGTPDIDVNEGGSFENSGTAIQNAGVVTIKSDGDVSGSIVANGNLNAEEVVMEMTVKADMWYFITTPWTLPVSTVTAPGNYIFRSYDGSVRARDGQGGWTNVEATGSLETGKGYIFQCNKAGTLTFTYSHPEFSVDMFTPLKAYISENTRDASWNFIGNPYPCYYWIKSMNYESPISVYDNASKKYLAYSPLDDDYALAPFQGFFVQKPDGVNSITYLKEGCTTYQAVQEALDGSVTEAPAARVAAASADRKLINLNLKAGNDFDNTRVVLNEERSTDYELTCDASKFMSHEAPIQLYSLDATNNRYAINERPVDNGDVLLGYKVLAAGQYTFHATRLDQSVTLYDTVTGIYTDLATADYSFDSEAGSFDQRFVLSVANASGITSFEAEGETAVYGIDGVRHADNTLNSGLYIRISDKRAHKVFVK